MNSNIAEQMCDAEELGRTGGENSLSVDSGGGQSQQWTRADGAWAGSGRMRSTSLAKRYSSQVQEMDDVTVGHVTRGI